MKMLLMLLLAAMPAAEVPTYDTAYQLWRESQQLRAQDDERGMKRVLREAADLLAEQLEAQPDDVEALALYGATIGDQITGMFSGMRLGPRADRALERARELGPDNPRVALIRGISAFHKPSTFGGGLDVAEAELTRAIALFEAQGPDPGWPDWGLVDALGWLALTIVGREDGDLARARGYLDRALALAPGDRWLLDYVRPTLDAAVAAAGD